MKILATLLALTTLSSAHAEWNKLDSTNTFNDVAVTRSEHDQIVASTSSQPFWGNQGPTAVLRTWNSAAFDPLNQIFYFMGGGHSDYGGNEIYSYALKTKTWARVTNPAPLVKQEDHSQKADTQVWVPQNSPISTHTYDGIVWNPLTKSIWYSSSHGFGGGRGKPSHNPATPAMWEYKLQSKKWIPHTADANFRRPMSVYLPSLKKLLFVQFSGGGRHAYLFDRNGKQESLGAIAGLGGVGGVSTLFKNTDTEQIYTATTQGIYEIVIHNGSASATKVAEYPSVEESQFSAHMGQASYNYRPVDKKFYIWSGGPKILTWDPQTNDFQVIWNEDSPEAPQRNGKGVNLIFEKFVYVAEQDYFVGTQFGGDGEGSDGVWTWQPTDNRFNINQLELRSSISAQGFELGDRIEIDGATQTSISLFVPIVTGDKNFNSGAAMQFRKKGTSTWRQGTELYRIRPDLVRNTRNSEFVSPKGFATIISGLASGTEYQFRVIVNDPDGVINSDLPILNASTSQRVSSPNTGAVISVKSQTEFEAALANGEPGQVIELAPGHYSPVRIRIGGTQAQPLFIRGSDRERTIIDGQQGTYGLRVEADHLHISDLTIQNANKAVQFIGNRKHVSLHSNILHNSITGIDARGGQSNLDIFNNVLRGVNQSGDISRDTWNDEGIVVTGNSIEIANNTLSGFGDAIGMHWRTSLPNHAINIHSNLIAYTGDDGIEFDFSLRNVAAHHNLILNAANGLSFQPVWGGPVYAFRNVIANTARGPLKIKKESDNPSGMHIYHNTFIKSVSEAGAGEAWKNSGGEIHHLSIMNNVFISPISSTGDTVKNTSAHNFLEMDYNAWSADGKFTMHMGPGKQHVKASDFAAWKNESLLGNHDILSSAKDFYLYTNLNIDDLSFEKLLDPQTFNLSLKPGSLLIDAGVRIPGFTRGMRGAQPDIGAMEAGESQWQYGADFSIEQQGGNGADNGTDTQLLVPSKTFYGTNSRDTIDASSSAERVGLFGLNGHDWLVGSNFDDVIEGGSGSDNMIGGTGNDIFFMPSPDSNLDTVHGGEGYDVILGNAEDNDFTLNTMTSVERIEGQGGVNRIVGNRYKQKYNFANTLLTDISLIAAGEGHDEIVGSPGDDNIAGEGGDDVIDGHLGHDTIVFSGAKKDYSIQRVNDNEVLVISTIEGRDRILNAEVLKFKDENVEINGLSVSNGTLGN